MSNLIKTKKIEFIIGRNNPKIKAIVNEVIFLINDSFLFLSSKILGEIKEDKKIEEYINILSGIQNEDLEYENKYFLFSKQIFQLKNLITISSFIEKKKEYIPKINDYINFEEKELLLYKKNDIESLKKIIEEEFRFLETFSTKENYYEFIIDIFINKYKSLNDIEIQKIIIKKILSNINFLKNSYYFFNLIFSYYEYDDVNLFDIDDPKLETIRNTKIDSINKKIFNIILLNIFNEKILYQFHDFSVDNIQNYFEKFNLFIESLIYNLDEEKDDKTENQVKNYEFIKIYKISYVKIFIYYISEIYSSKELYNQFNDRINFIDLIKNTNNYDSFEIYFIKCLKFFNDNSFSNFVFNNGFDYFEYFGLENIKIKYFEKEKTNEYFYHPLEVIYINDLPSYLKLKELYNNNLEEDIVKKMIEVKDEMFFFDFIFNELLCFFFQ